MLELSAPLFTWDPSRHMLLPAAVEIVSIAAPKPCKKAPFFADDFNEIDIYKIKIDLWYLVISCGI